MICSRTLLHFATTLTMMVSADLPSFVYRTSNCPTPGNISEWNKASDRLGCPNRIESESPKEQEKVYHCIPSNYLNETVEFCGKNVPIEGGFCPVYTYEFGPNESANYKNCSSFVKGCPEDEYYSKWVFHHRECLHIDNKGECYRSDPNCCLDDSCVTKPADKEIQMPLSYLIVALMTIGIFVLLLFLCICLDITTIKKRNQQREDEFPLLKQAKLHDCLFTIGETLQSESVTRLKQILEGTLQNDKVKKLRKISNGRDLIKYMHGLYDFSMNFYILQGFMELIKEEELTNKCRLFAEGYKQDITFYRRRPLYGYTNVTIKLPAENMTQISDRRIQSIRNNLMHLIDAKFDDIVFRGISEGCVLIHTEMRPPLLPRIKKLGIFSAFIFQKYEISDIYSENKCLYSNTKVLSADDKDLMDQTKYSSTSVTFDSLIGQIKELPNLPVSTDFINIAVMGPAIQGKLTFIEMCKDALQGETTIATRAAVQYPSSNSTTPLIVISSKTQSGRPVKIRILQSEKLRPLDTVVDNCTLATEAKRGQPCMSDFNQKIHCVVFDLDSSKKHSQFGYDEIDLEKMKNSLKVTDKPKYAFICSGNQYEDVFKSRVKACDELRVPLRMILPDCDPESYDTRDNVALRSLSSVISHAIKYLNKNN